MSSLHNAPLTTSLGIDPREIIMNCCFNLLSFGVIHSSKYPESCLITFMVISSLEQNGKIRNPPLNLNKLNLFVEICSLLYFTDL